MRGKGEGSIGKRADGRHYAYLTITEPSGETKRRYFYGKTEREVRAKLREAQRRHDEGSPVAPKKQTVSQYLTAWLETARPSLRAATYSKYELYVRRHIIPAIGGLQVRTLQREDVQNMLNKQQGALVPGETRRLTRAVLKRALSDALRDGTVTRNVAALTRAPEVIKTEMKFWVPREVRTFLKSIEDHRFEALFNTYLSIGLRRGEALALKWQDLDLNKGTLTVRSTLSRRGGGIIVNAPKTATSAREILLPRSLVQMLRAHRVRQLENKFRAGEDWKNKGYVFTTFAGNSIEPRIVNRTLDTLIAKSCVPRIRVHDLRHTAATLMILNGTPIKVVSEILGHSNIRITMDLYVHVLGEQRAEAADRMDKMLWGK